MLHSRGSQADRAPGREPRGQCPRPQFRGWAGQYFYRDRAGGVVLCVSNTGPPVPAEKVDGLLEPFQRLDDRADGFGLGLSIVKAIADAHGANLECRPGAGGGLVVRVTFPVSPAVVGEAVPSGQLAAGQSEAEPVVAGSHA